MFWIYWRVLSDYQFGSNQNKPKDLSKLHAKYVRTCSYTSLLHSFSLLSPVALLSYYPATSIKPSHTCIATLSSRFIYNLQTLVFANA